MLHNDFVTDILEIIRAKCYLAAHFDSPALAGTYASECSGGGYTRVLTTFTEVANRTIWNAHPVTFNGISSTRVLYICGWSELKNGDMRFMAELTDPINVQEGGGFQLLTGEVAVSL